MRDRTETLEHAAPQVFQHLNEAVPRPVIDRCLKDLTDDGLLALYENSKVEERKVPRFGSYTRIESEQFVRIESRHTISDPGKRFLLFVADPEILAD